MHARLADVFRSLAAFARQVSRPRDDGRDVDARRRLITQQVTDVQGFIESSKFEAGAGGEDAQEVERLTADAQAVFVVLLAIARDAATGDTVPDAVRAATIRVDEEVAVVLETLAGRVGLGGAAASEVSDRLASFERAIAVQVDAARGHISCAGTLGLYRELAVALSRLASVGGRSLPMTAGSIEAW